MTHRTTAEIVADLREVDGSPTVGALRSEAADQLAALYDELGRIRHALSATTVEEMVVRLTKAADFYDPADDWLLDAAIVLSASVSR